MLVRGDRASTGLIAFTPINAAANKKSGRTRLDRPRLIFRANARGIGKRYKLFLLVYLGPRGELTGRTRSRRVTIGHSPGYGRATSELRASRFARCLFLHCLLLAPRRFMSANSLSSDPASVPSLFSSFSPLFFSSSSSLFLSLRFSFAFFPLDSRSKTRKRYGNESCQFTRRNCQRIPTEWIHAMEFRLSYANTRENASNATHAALIDMFTERLPWLDGAATISTLAR